MICEVYMMNGERYLVYLESDPFEGQYRFIRAMYVTSIGGNNYKAQSYVGINSRHIATIIPRIGGVLITETPGLNAA